MKRLTILTAFIALTIASYGQNQTKEENLKIVWCEEYKWKIASNQEDKTTHFLEIIPGKDKIEKWTLLGTMMSLKNTKITKTEQVVEMYRQSSLKESPIIFMVFYPALTILNLIITIVLSLFKMTQAKIYKQIVIGQLMLFVPLVILISEF